MSLTSEERKRKCLSNIYTMADAYLLMLDKENATYTVNAGRIEVTFGTETKNNIHLPFVLV